MAQNLTHYSIFLASPSDVSEERLLIESSINELNRTVCKTLNVRLDLLKWETDSYPSVGDYSQNVINQQISDYDFFIGVMWGKIGSPTPTSKSGTIEEFNIAYEKLKRGSDVKILFYFSNKPLPPSEINPEQLIEVNSFKKELGDKGVYYYHYTLPEEFQHLIKIHITEHLNNLIHKRKDNNQQSYLNSINNSTVESNDINDIEELGFFEYLDICRESFFEVESSLERLTNYITELGANISKRAEKITSYNNMPFDTSKEAKKEIDRASNDMLDYVKRTNVELPIFHDHYYKGMEALSNALTIQEEDGMVNLSDLEFISSTLDNNHQIFTTTIGQIEGFKRNVSKLPRISSSITLAKNKVDLTLANLLSELESTQNLTEELSKRIKSFISSYSKD